MMQRIGLALRGWSGGMVRAGAVVTAALVLASCGSGGGTSSGTAVSQFFQAGKEDKGDIDPALLAPDSACPVVRTRPGTQSLRRTSGEGENATLNWQASITRTARECTKTGTGTTMRVGVSGRIIEGAGGAPGRVDLPIRIAVREGGNITYSQLHTVSVERAQASQSWAFVDENVVVERPDAAEIIVGFDG